MENSNARTWRGDTGLTIIIGLLVLAGVVMVFSSSAALTLEMGVHELYFLIKQIIAVSIGLGVMVFMFRIDYRMLADSSVYLTLLVLALGMLVLVLYMPEINNTHRWFRLLGFNFQPSEFAKLVLLIVLAAVASQWRALLNNWGFIFLTLAVFAAPVIFLIAIQPDLGTAAILSVSAFSILFAAGIGMRKIFILVVIAAVLISIFIMVSPYRMQRIVTFLDPTADPLGSGYQAAQSEIALGSGGLTGRGFMYSNNKLFYLPAAHTDFVFSIVGEEIGFAGTALLLALYLLLFMTGVKIAFTARDFFGFLLATGITVLIVGQALMNMSVAATMLPTKGIPLPLISYGGTSAIFTLAGLGLLLNISQYCKKEK